MPDSYGQVRAGNVTPHTNGGPAPSTRGTSIDSVISRIETVNHAIGSMTDRLKQLADTTMGATPTEANNTKIDHPPQTLQEWTSYLEDNVSRLDAQLSRFF